ncbi:MAG TPA: 3,4-dihydroxy-2-butanone-4-phosphate synthase [Candidatus Thermoplasmatota archaeon]|nr:3,4-dihydroxy-2-butanone-4-phosphate synthase [Candidatus Thermoplasmatota archaeon]
MDAPALARTIDLLRAGRFVLLYDDDRREKEVDLFLAAEHATPEALATLRREAGGLVFLAVDPRVGEKLGLPFLHDLFADAAAKHPVLAKLTPNDIRYDARSSFSLTINHRRTFTGITDDDRALTVREFGRLARDALAGATPAAAQDAFGQAFRAPGHVHLCVGAKRLLAERKGHTELAVALARLAGVTPVLVGAEMLATGKARSKEDAAAWARERGSVLVSGREVEDAWLKVEAGAAR